MLHYFILLKRLFSLFILCLLTSQVSANVLLGGTRIIYNESDKEVTIRLSNTDANDSLVQVWFDSNDPKSTPETGTAPFIATPPIFRLDKNKSQTLRIIFVQDPIARDKESVFWLNVLDIPPAPPQSVDDTNYMQIAIRSRIKLFYRPTGLVGTPKEAGKQVTWALAQTPSGIVLRANNDSDYNVSLGKVTAHIGDKEQNIDASMLSPKSSSDFAMSKLSNVPDGVIKIDYESINDYGGKDSHQYSIVR